MTTVDLLRDLNDKSIASGGGGAIEPEPIERAEDVAEAMLVMIVIPRVTNSLIDFAPDALGAWVTGTPFQKAALDDLVLTASNTICVK